ncbi:hypothetical protein ABT075_13245 [Streptomyces sp. NPDC002677]|uniref:hypothetical protein n=1 Tax=Streptomyces sp. NPDC002677 TaxID=3154774 RepID=UPI0033174CA4
MGLAPGTVPRRTPGLRREEVAELALDSVALRDRVHAVVFAFDHGLVRPGGR